MCKYVQEAKVVSTPIIYICVINKNSLYKETECNCISDTENLNCLCISLNHTPFNEAIHKNPIT